MKAACLRASACVGLLFAAAAPASNGLNLVGFGAESLGLGSADLAVARDANAVNINPAGLTQIGARRFDGYIVPFYSIGFEHGDARNRNYKIDNPEAIFNGGGYAQRINEKLVVGAGVFLSGGTGIKYENLVTPFGTRDEYSAVLGVTKLATGLGWQVNDKLSLGAGLNLSYASTRQKLFPDTVDENAGFFGLRIDGADGTSVNARLGVQYRHTPTFNFGMSYANMTDVKLQNGTLTLNYGTFDNLGRVKYRDADITGLALAEELGAGLAWQFRPRWLFAGELTWLNWSEALKDARVRARDPQNPAAPAEVAFAQPLDHRDQYVVGLGLAYDWSGQTVLRAGFNYGRNPIPNRTLTPTFNLTANYDLALGFAHKLRKGWEFASTVQIQPHKVEHYNNPTQPFGPARADYGVIAFTLQLSRSW